MLPKAWQVYPAATDDLVLLDRYLGREGSGREGRSMIVAGPDGTVHRSVVLPWGVDGGHVAGEVEAGVVTWSGIGRWDGGVNPLPVAMSGDDFVDPRPFGVLAGRVVLFEGVDYIESVDVLTDRRRRLAVPAVERRGPWSSRFSLRNNYSADGAWLTAADQLGSVVAGLGGELRWLPHDHEGWARRRTLWFGNRLIVFARDWHSADEYEPAADRLTPVTLGPIDEDRGPWPRVEVTSPVSFDHALRQVEAARVAAERPLFVWEPDDFSWLSSVYTVAEFAGGVSEEAIAAAEAQIGPFPRGYRSFVSSFGAARLDEREIFGLGDGSSRWSRVVEQTLWERHQADKELPRTLIAISNDGFGNVYCVRTSEDSDDESVYVWWHDDDSEAEVVAESFESWLRLFSPPSD
jgi:hypothetical protein